MEFTQIIDTTTPDSGYPYKDFYKEGNVIHINYWNSYDLVLKYGVGGEGISSGWAVQVIKCNKNGTPLPDAKPRWHCTPPGNDKIITNIAK